MEFGLLKSKIETKLSKSYTNNSFKKEIKKFNKYVLECPEINKAYYIYDELSKEKGFEKSFAEEYLNECIDLYGRIQISSKQISLLESWVKDVKCVNEYKDIDDVLNNETFIIENILNSKKSIVNRLTTKKEIVENVKIPLNKMLEVANTTLKNYLETLSESEVSLIKKYKTLSESEIKNRYNILSEMTIEKLELIAENADSETKSRINETIVKIKNDVANYVSLFKLRTLNESL